MILRTWCKLVKNKFGYSKKMSSKTEPINEVCCDNCFKLTEERVKDTIQYEKKYSKQLCGRCRRIENGKIIGIIGSQTLLSFTKEQKREYSSNAGKSSHIKSPSNKGKFSTIRWDKMSSEEQMSRVKKANKALHDKLNNDENFKNAHYLKIFKNSRIGFISKGHNELHDFLKEFGFIQHFQISDMETDECNEKLKIVIEYNGDMYHCNPRKWKPDEYNSVIKMTASEKWARDRNRYYKLKRMGYVCFVVWEDDWFNNRDLIKQKIIKFINKRKNEIN
jgi:hypothetical protein